MTSVGMQELFITVNANGKAESPQGHRWRGLYQSRVKSVIVFDEIISNPSFTIVAVICIFPDLK